ALRAPGRQVGNGPGEAQLRLLLAADDFRLPAIDDAAQVTGGDGEELVAVLRIAGSARRPHHHVLDVVIHHALGVGGQGVVDALEGRWREAPGSVHTLAEPNDDVIAVELYQGAVRRPLGDEQADGVRSAVDRSEAAWGVGLSHVSSSFGLVRARAGTCRCSPHPPRWWPGRGRCPVSRRSANRPG